MTVVVYTTVLSQYDNLRPPAVIEPGVRYLCFSDEFQDCPPWETVPAYRPYKCDSRNSRIPKILAHLSIDADYSIYHDGCLTLARKPSELIAEHLQGADIAMYRHPCRKSIYEELECCERLSIGYGADMAAQVERYRGHGLREGLWAGGVIIRRHTDLTALLNEIWWKEYLAGCARDQISFPFARLAVGLNINTIDADILQDSKRFQFRFHAAFKAGNEEFEEQRKRRADRRAKLQALCV